MGAIELFLAVVICGCAGLASAVPFAAWGRTGDPRFGLVAGANLALLALGLVWLWGALPVSAPSYASATPLALGLVALVAMLLLATGIVPRRR
jgi:hypothetical protein